MGSQHIITVGARLLVGALRAAVGTLFFLGCLTVAYAQDMPPLEVPVGGPPAKGDALSAGDWLLYPSIGVFSAYSDNLFQSPINPIKSWFFGIDPGLIAQWSNGIHSTTLYGNAEGRGYPTQDELNAFDNEAGFIQKYSPLPDLTFGLQGDYTHKTLASALINGIPGQITAGQPTPPTPVLTVANSTTVVNPYDQFTTTASVEKILNGGIIGLSAGISRSDYQNTTLNPDYTVKTFTGKGAFSLGPMFYVYSDGSFAGYETSSVFTARGGIGTRQIGLFSASAYVGQQGSEVQNSGSAGGNIFGGKLSYFPTSVLTLNLAFDETKNISSETGMSNLALNQQPTSVLVIPIAASTQISSYSLQTAYTISEEWSLFVNLGYTRAEYLSSPELDNAWLADGVLRYAMTPRLSLSWEYQYSSVVSNVALTSSKRNYIMMRAGYNF